MSPSTHQSASIDDGQGQEAWTPGPWFAGRLVLADPDDEFGTISIGQQDISDRPNKDAHFEDTICEVWQNPNLAEDAEANARLIAAAPELLEALEDIVTSCTIIQPAHLSDAVANAHAAIAKARGQ